MKRFDIIEHTADIGIATRGKDLKEAFANAAYAMFSLMVDLGTVVEREKQDVKVEAEDYESLLVSWLNELLYYLDTQQLLFCRFEITDIQETSLQAHAYGERIDTSRHCLDIGVKAATYHMLRVEKRDGWWVQIIFDV